MTFQVIKNDTLNCELQYIPVNDDIWFRGKTVAFVLGYSNSPTDKGYVKAIRKFVEDEDKCKLGEIEGVSKMDTLKKNEKNTIVINESGLYCLILASKLPTAKKFKRWVTKEVLPTIRQTGSYEIPKAQPRSDIDKQLENTTLDLMKILLTDKDCKLQTVARDYIHNKFSQKQITHQEEDEYARDITDICKDEFGFVPNFTQKIKIGQLLKKEYDKTFDEPLLKCEKYCNGAMRKVNAYPKDKEHWIVDTLKEYGQSS